MQYDLVFDLNSVKTSLFPAAGTKTLNSHIPSMSDTKLNTQTADDMPHSKKVSLVLTTPSRLNNFSACEEIQFFQGELR